MSEQLVLIERGVNQVITLTLNRPDQLNALNRPLLLQLQNELRLLVKEDQARVVIFSGMGKLFCAGADLKERQSMTLAETRHFIRLISDTFYLIASLPMPTIAAMNGSAFGGGLELALACDFRILCEDALVGLTECAWGIIPGAGGTQRLPKIIGATKAKELIFMAQKITAGEAKAIGLVGEIVESSEDICKAAQKMALQIMKCAPLSVRAAKKAIVHGELLEEEEGLKLEEHCYESILDSQDRLEGLAAFAQKRAPRFSGI